MRANVMQVSACVTVMAAAIAGPIVLFKTWKPELAAAAPTPASGDPRFFPVSREPEPDPLPAASAPVPQRFTKIEFDNYAYGKTKAQIRAAFGAPMMVHDNDDSWYYSDLPIYDVEAGIQVSVRVRFSGIPGPDDFVSEVIY